MAWITTSARRVATLRAEAQRHVGMARMFVFTHEGRYTPADPAAILGPIWQGLGEDQERPLLAKKGEVVRDCLACHSGVTQRS